MLATINTFLFIFFAALCADLAISSFSILHLVVILFSAIITAILSYKLGIIKKDGDLSFLYLNLYTFFVKSYFSDLAKMILRIHEPFLLRFDISPTLFKEKLQHNDRIDMSILTSAINMRQGFLVYRINKSFAYIYCLKEGDYEDLNLLRLTKDIRDINDNSLV